MVQQVFNEHRVPQEFARKVLEGVADLDYRKTGETTFAGSVVACMEYLKKPVAYEYVMGISGAAFKLLWHRGWCPSNNSMGILGEEPVRRTFRTLGFEHEIVNKTDSPECEGAFRRKIIESIDAGRPVIAWGIIGPPDEGIVAGYEKGGEVLLGRSYFRDGSKGYYEKAEWYKDCLGILLIGGKTEAPSKGQILREALHWAVELARTPTSDELPTADGGRAAGLAAYDAWGEALKRDEDFPENDLKVLTFRCLVSNSVTLSGLREARMTAVQFLKSMADVDGAAASDILAAAAAYEEEVAILHEALEMAPFHFAPEEKRLQMANPGLRRRLVKLILQAKEKERQAVEHLERAVQKLEPD